MLCFICQKHAGQVGLPPGGYLYEDERWKVCHAPLAEANPGTLLVESRRHFLDFTEMDEAEAGSYGRLLQTLYAALKEVTGAERIYALTLLEGIPHFHTWLVPHGNGTAESGLQFLVQARSSRRDEALAMVRALRKVLSP
jgi:diadenosine tetraphosphate (Ap4A) HIT family hydrolase